MSMDHLRNKKIKNEISFAPLQLLSSSHFPWETRTQVGVLEACGSRGMMTRSLD